MSRSAASCRRWSFKCPAHQEAQEGHPAQLVQTPGDAIVQQGHPAIRLDEQVAAVQVPVKHAKERGPLEKNDQEGSDNGGGIDPGPAHTGHVVPAKAREPFHDQHTASHEVRVRAGHHHGPLIGLGQYPGYVEHVVGLEAEVEFLHDRLREQLDQGRWVGQGGHRDAPDQVGRQPRHGGDVAAHEARRPGAAAP